MHPSLIRTLVTKSELSCRVSLSLWSCSVANRDETEILVVIGVETCADRPIPEVAAKVRWEEAVDERIGCRVQRSQTLDECCNGDHGLGFRDVAVNLKQVEYDVRSPAQDKDCFNVSKVNIRLPILGTLRQSYHSSKNSCVSLFFTSLLNHEMPSWNGQDGPSRQSFVYIVTIFFDQSTSKGRTFAGHIRGISTHLISTILPFGLNHSDVLLLASKQDGVHHPVWYTILLLLCYICFCCYLVFFFSIFLFLCLLK